jgi:hypothetical protein
MGGEAYSLEITDSNYEMITMVDREKQTYIYKPSTGYLDLNGVPIDRQPYFKQDEVVKLISDSKIDPSLVLTRTLLSCINMMRR